MCVLRAIYIVTQNTSVIPEKAGQMDMEQASVRCTDLFRLLSDQMSSDLYSTPSMILFLVHGSGRTLAGALFVL